jgi:type VI secretion system protein ImpJ
VPGKNKIIWSEGLFLRPQHFQQQDRFTELYVEHRTGGLRSYPWGFTELRLDQDLLAVGKLAVVAAKGVFPDGTPFSIPEDDEPPPPLEVEEAHRGAFVYLSLPLREEGAVEVAVPGAEVTGLPRYLVRERATRDTSGFSDSTSDVQLGSLRLRLLTDKDPRNEYACLGVAQVVECRPDKKVALEARYIPPVLSVQASPRAAGMLNELQGLLFARAEALARVVAGAGKGGVSEVADFMLLQVANGYHALVSHLAAGHVVHPEAFYAMLVQLGGELATFRSATRRPPKFPPYRHDDLRNCLEPLLALADEWLATTGVQNVVPIPLKIAAHAPDYRSGKIPEPALVDNATFVLAVSSDMPADELQRRVPVLFKVAAGEDIAQLVVGQLPGIQIRPLPAAPRQIPFHTGYAYFELDRYGPLWDGLRKSYRIAIHVSGNFPGLAIELWAIRG